MSQAIERLTRKSYKAGILDVLLMIEEREKRYEIIANSESIQDDDFKRDYREQALAMAKLRIEVSRLIEE